MKIFWCIPGALFSKKSPDEIENDKKILENELRKYYGKLEIEAIRKNDLDNIEVYVMGKPKYDGFQEEIQSSILAVVLKTYGERPRQSTLVKLNYGAFNPNFSPISDRAQDSINNQKNDTIKEVNNSNFPHQKLLKNLEK